MSQVLIMCDYLSARRVLGAAGDPSGRPAAGSDQELLHKTRFCWGQIQGRSPVNMFHSFILAGKPQRGTKSLLPGNTGRDFS